MPASETTLRYFCAHLSALTSYPTIKVYLAGIRLLHIENGFADPTKEAPLLHYLCTAIRRSQSTPPKKRQPITVSLLKIMEKELFRSNLPSRDKSAYWAAFILAFYGFLRASEYTTPSSSQYSSTTHLTVRDVTITTSSLQLHLKRSKTDRYDKSAKLIVGPTHSLTCPVRAMQKYLAIHQRERRGSLFTLQSGKFITCRDVSSIPQQLLRSANLDWERYSGHSYRVGAATAAAAAGLPDHLIKTLGRWHSRAYQGYTRTSPEILRTATSQISRAQ